MAKIPSYLKRSTAILKMPEAIERGLTPSAFIKELKAEGISYRRTNMLADWRNVAGFEARKDAYKYIRKDRLPSKKFVVDVDWKLHNNYMYKFAVFTQETIEKELKPQHINIMKADFLSIPIVEAEVYSRWGVTDSIPKEPIIKIQLIGIWHRVPSLAEPTPSPFIVE